MSDGPRATVEEYYEALRRGEPLDAYFVEDDDVVKFGIGETLVGDDVAEGLREQTRRTDDWRVESRDLRVVEREGYASFADSVRMAWRDGEEEHDYETRWSGTLERRGDEGEWAFLGMHVSVAVGDV